MQDAKVGKFTFEVAKTANKTAIKRAVEKKFAVHAVSIKTLIVKGRRKRMGKKMIEKVLQFWKKAIVAVKQGEKIDLFDIGEK